MSAFSHLCSVLVYVCMLIVPVTGDMFILHTDASSLGVGGLPNVVCAGNELPVGFYARQIRGAENSYSATELEALAVISSIAHFAPVWTSC